jgi:hypothetical protein
MNSNFCAYNEDGKDEKFGEGVILAASSSFTLLCTGNTECLLNEYLTTIRKKMRPQVKKVIGRAPYYL